MVSSENGTGRGNMQNVKELLNGKKTVIFDLDGTLVDSMWIWTSIDIEYLARYGYKLPADLQPSIEGMSFTETARYFKERFQIPESIEEIKDCWNQMTYQKYTEEVPLKKGVLEFLQQCRQQGIRMGIATSNSPELAQAVVEVLDISKYFQVIATACQVAAGKPAPDIYLYVADRLQVEPKECLVFEDVVAGIMAGRNAGMQVIAVEDAFSTGDAERKKKLAQGYIQDFTEMLF